MIADDQLKALQKSAHIFFFLLLPVHQNPEKQKGTYKHCPTSIHRKLLHFLYTSSAKKV